MAAVAEDHLALDGVAGVMARSRIGIEEVLHLVPAHPRAAAVLGSLDCCRPFLLRDHLALHGRRRVRLVDPHFLPVEERHVPDGEALVDGTVG